MAILFFRWFCGPNSFFSITLVVSVMMNWNSIFRPCAMVVPDFGMICEIMLMSEGFIDARLLARKFITLYELCRELLSKQVWSFKKLSSMLWYSLILSDYHDHDSSGHCSLSHWIVSTSTRLYTERPKALLKWRQKQSFQPLIAPNFQLPLPFTKLFQIDANYDPNLAEVSCVSCQ